MTTPASRRRDLLIALLVACVSLAAATAAAVVMPMRARWEAAFVSLAACLLGGAVAALALRLRDGPDRAETGRGVAAAALGYGLALSAAVNGPAALRLIAMLVRVDAPAAATAPAALLLAAWLALSTRRIETGIDPFRQADPDGDGDEDTRP